jgi:hypothetical protein
MRFLPLLVGAVCISSCSQNPGLISSLNGSQPQLSRLDQSTPNIKNVSKVVAKQHQTIVITGSGFGKTQPYNGDSAYLQILDTTGGWSAGHENSYEIDTVHLKVTQWVDNKSVIAGFTGGYGQEYWVLHKGDHLNVNVWNASNGDGPATQETDVK